MNYPTSDIGFIKVTYLLPSFLFRLGKEEVESLFSGLENNQRLQALSLRYCGLGPQSGPWLGAIICQTAIR